MSDTDQKPDIAFVLYDALPVDFEAGLVDGLENEALAIRVSRISNGPFAGVELYLPAAAMLVVATAYFTGFVQKAGEDHYDLLKQAAKKLWRKASALKITTVASAPGKITNTTYSLAYAIMGEVSPDLRFKFVVRVELDEAEADDGIRAFLDLLRDIHTDSLSEEDIKALLTYRPVGGTVLVTFDPKARRIVPVDAFERVRAE